MNPTAFAGRMRGAGYEARSQVGRTTLWKRKKKPYGPEYEDYDPFEHYLGSVQRMLDASETGGEPSNLRARMTESAARRAGISSAAAKSNIQDRFRQRGMGGSGAEGRLLADVDRARAAMLSESGVDIDKWLLTEGHRRRMDVLRHGAQAAEMGMRAAGGQRGTTVSQASRRRPRPGLTPEQDLARQANIRENWKFLQDNPLFAETSDLVPRSVKRYWRKKKKDEEKEGLPGPKT